MKFILTPLLIALALTTLYGCGSGDSSNSSTSSGTTPVADTYVFPAGTATITFSAMSTAKLSAPVSEILVALNLPVGMSVTTTGGASGLIDGTTVTAGSALTGTSLAFGTYSASTRTAYLSTTITSDSYRSGEFLRLICTVASGPVITLADLKAANDPVTIVKAVGYDSTSKSTVTLTDKLKVTIGALK